MEGLLDRGSILLGQHLSGSQGPLAVDSPEWVAATSVHHQQCFWSNGLPRRLHDRFVERVVVVSEGSQPISNAWKARSFSSDYLPIQV
jgi:sensor domain CHASE-containing protein